MSKICIKVDKFTGPNIIELNSDRHALKTKYWIKWKTGKA